MPMYGHKSAQFVDLLGYYASKLLTINEVSGFDKSVMPRSVYYICAYALQMQDRLWNVLDLLKKQNELLMSHPNALLYK